MVDIIVALVVAIFVVVGGAFLGYNFRKLRERKETRNEIKPIENDDLILIAADIISFATFENADKRKAERKAFISLCKASDLYSWMTDDKIEEDAGRYFDNRMAYYDGKEDDTCEED